MPVLAMNGRQQFGETGRSTAKHKTILEEERNVFPKRRNEDQGPDNTIESPDKPSVGVIRGKCENARGSSS